MLSLTNTAAMHVASTTHPDPRLRSLMALRLSQLGTDPIHIVVFEAGDTLKELETVIGFTPLEAMPSWEWIEAHPGWFELAYVFSDDGDGAILFVSRAEGVDADLLALCNRWAVT